MYILFLFVSCAVVYVVFRFNHYLFQYSIIKLKRRKVDIFLVYSQKMKVNLFNRTSTYICRNNFYCDLSWTINDIQITRKAGELLDFEQLTNLIEIFTQLSLFRIFRLLTNRICSLDKRQSVFIHRFINWQ